MIMNMQKQFYLRLNWLVDQNKFMHVTFHYCAQFGHILVVA